MFPDFRHTLMSKLKPSLQEFLLTWHFPPRECCSCDLQPHLGFSVILIKENERKTSDTLQPQLYTRKKAYSKTYMPHKSFALNNTISNISHYPHLNGFTYITGDMMDYMIKFSLLNI